MPNICWFSRRCWHGRDAADLNSDDKCRLLFDDGCDLLRRGGCTVGHLLAEPRCRGLPTSQVVKPKPRGSSRPHRRHGARMTRRSTGALRIRCAGDETWDATLGGWCGCSKPGVLVCGQCWLIILFSWTQSIVWSRICPSKNRSAWRVAIWRVIPRQI